MSETVEETTDATITVGTAEAAPADVLDLCKADLAKLKDDVKSIFTDASNRVLAATAELTQANADRDKIVGFMNTIGLAPGSF